MKIITNLLMENKSNILRRWFDLILETYPSDTADLIRKDKDPFTNPVGSTLSRGIEILFGKLCEDIIKDEECQETLNSIIKIRSVQDISASEAVEFIFFLKKAIEEILGNDIFKEPFIRQWLNFQSRIDRLALLAFNTYMGAREKVCEIRIKQARLERDMAFRMIERMAHSKD